MEILGSRFPRVLSYPRRSDWTAAASGLEVLRRAVPEFTGRAALVGKYIILGRVGGSREAKFAGFHELNHHWLGTTHPVQEVSGGRGGSRYEEIMADAGAGAALAPHAELRRVLALALRERSTSSLAPRTLKEWAAVELKSRALRSAVERFDVNYDVVVRALADAGLVVGAMPWGEQTWVVTEYKAWRSRLTRLGSARRQVAVDRAVEAGAARDLRWDQWLEMPAEEFEGLLGMTLEELDQYLARRALQGPLQ